MIVYRGRVYTPLGDPFASKDSWSYWENGYLAVSHGRIAGVGSWDEKPDDLDGEVVQFGSENLISPGFIDTHLHAPQLEMIGSYGGHLLEWLERYTFPTEAKFADDDHALRYSSGV